MHRITFIQAGYNAGLGFHRINTMFKHLIRHLTRAIAAYHIRVGLEHNKGIGVVTAYRLQQGGIA